MFKGLLILSVILILFFAFFLPIMDYNMGYKKGLQQGMSDTLDGRAYCPEQGYGIHMQVYLWRYGANANFVTAKNFNRGYRKGYDEGYKLDEAKKAFLKNEKLATLVNYFTHSYISDKKIETPLGYLYTTNGFVKEKVKAILGNCYDQIEKIRNGYFGAKTKVKTGITMKIVKEWLGSPSKESNVHSKEIDLIYWSYFFPENKTIRFSFKSDDLFHVDADKFTYRCTCFQFRGHST